jgi:alanine racemase
VNEGVAVSSDVELLSTRATRAIIDLDRIAGNVRVFRRLVGPGVKLMAVVKANGYGHGAVMVAKTALEAGADYLSVATVDEGIQLRQAGIGGQILVLGPVHAEEISAAIHGKLELAVGSSDAIAEIAEIATWCSAEEPIKVHLKIDTGMRRFGATLADLPAIAAKLACLSSLQLAGTFTHFAAADEADETPTLDQASIFEEALAELERSGLDPGVRHAANSAATLRARRYDFDMVRIGISLYGIAPSDDVHLVDGILPAMSVRSRVSRVIELAPGDRVSYGGTYVATRHERAGLIPIGYADGYRRGLSHRAWAKIGGYRCPILGRVCMDQTVVGLPSHSVVREGDEVLIAGDSSSGAPTLDDLARLTDTIAYEIATGISKRVPRIYTREGQVVAVEDLHGLREFA